MKTAKVALTDRAIKAARPAIKAYDMHDAVVPSLALNVLPSGLKRFVLLRRFPGSKHPTRRALGAYGGLTLERARAKARQWLELIAAGVDPADELERQRREQERKRAITFGSVAEDYIRREVYGPGGEKKPRHRTAGRTVSALRNVLIPLFGHRPVAELTAREILEPLELIGQIGSDHALLKLKARKQMVRPGRKRRPALSQARSLFAFMEMVLNWASAPDAHYGLDRSPLERVRVSRYFGRAETRDHVLNDDELATLQVAISRLRPPHRQMYQVLLHSGLRLNEVAGARVGELEGDTWTIPAERMKGKNGEAKPHVVPITAALRKAFDSLPRGDAGDFIFSCDGGRSPMVTGGTTLKERLDRLMLQAWQERLQARGRNPAKTPLRPFRNHDLRRSCRSTLSRLGVRHEHAEAVLAHARGGVVGRYDLWEYFPEKRDALERWSKFLAGLTQPRLAKAETAMA
jgi:integrase